MDQVLRSRLAALGAWAERLVDPTFSMGQWAGGERLSNGAISMPWFQLSAEAEAFLRDLAEHGWVRPFEWMAWLETPTGRRLREDPGAVEAADAADLRRLLTAMVRSERFSDGSIAGAHASGLLGRICRRAAVLAAETDRP